MKECKTCKELLNEDKFYSLRDRKGNPTLTARCKDCMKQARRDQYSDINRKDISDAARLRSQRWNKNNREKINKRRKEYYLNNKELVAACNDRWRGSNPEKLRLSRIKKLYGVDQSYITDLMDSQKGCCDICKESLVFPDSIREYAIDHCHTTDKVRGLLCHSCNHLLGNSFDSKDILLSAIHYLDKHKEK